MTKFNRSVALQLEDKGLEPKRIPSFLRNMENVLALLPNPTTQQVNKWIGSLGYADVTLDDVTLQWVITSVQRESRTFPE